MRKVARGIGASALGVGFAILVFANDCVAGQAHELRGITLPDGSSGSGAVSFSPLLALAAAAVVVLFVSLKQHRLQDQKVSAWLMSPVDLFAALLSLLLAGGIGGELMINVLGSPAPPAIEAASEGVATAADLKATALRGFGSIMGQALFVGALILGLRLRGMVWGAHSLSRPRSILLGLLCFALSWPIVQFAAMLASLGQQQLGGGPPDSLGHSTLQALQSGEQGIWWIIVVATATIGAPVLEEFAYRGILQQALKRLGAGKWLAILITSILFASMHIGALSDGGMAAGITAIFTLSLALGYIYERTGSLLAPMVAHAAFNATNLLLLMAGL